MRAAVADWLLWIKAAHVIAVIAWMAGLLYLPRLFVYHADAAPHSEMSETFKLMEGRLYRAIMTPAMIAAWGLGLTLAAIEGFTGYWLLVKLAAVIGLSGVHQWLGRFATAFAGDRRPRPARFFRLLNEVPTLLLIVIVIMAVVKPF